MMMKAVRKITGMIYGWGIMLALFVGGLSFLGYLWAIFAGGETAAAICAFIYKTLYPELVYWTSIVVLVGVIRTYIKE
ncbi:MAG: hypothetical protein IJP89_07720 [Synergistaceae bacterium]|nr:hypothetical protein [Synergistaceae bacterium]